MTPQEQARAFWAMMLAGVCMGGIYDLLGPLRRVRGLCVLTDMFFGVCCAAGIVMTALRLQCDAFRLYAFAGAGCGMVLYGVTMGAAIRRIAGILRKWMTKMREKYKKSSTPAGI